MYNFPNLDVKIQRRPPRRENSYESMDCRWRINGILYITPILDKIF